MIHFLYLAAGIGLLTLGGESFIRGSLALARRLGLSPLLCGLVIVGFGTSAPELAVSIDAALNQQPDIAVGNVVGSNIGNILLVLGLCALITPLAVKPLALRRDAVTVVAASFLFVGLVGGNSLARGDAAILLFAFGAYLAFAYWSERNRADPAAELHIAESEEVGNIPQTPLGTTLLVITGFLLLMGGSRVLLIGAVGLAQSLGISEAVIALTLVAVGTSLPELSISVIASFRRHADIAVGNILGSNIFNLLGILGISALLQPLAVHQRILQFDQWIMAGSAVLLLVFLYTGRRLSRIEGAFLLALYVAYIYVSFTKF